MIFNSEKKYIFVRSTKVASTSLMSAIIKAETKNEKILRIGNFYYQSPLAYTYGTISNKDFPSRAHLSIHAISEFFNENIFKDYYKFGVVRNPYTHAVSRFLFEEIVVKRGIKNFFRATLRTKISLIKSILMIPNNKTTFKFFIKNLFLGQHKFLGNNLDEFDLLLRFEHLEEDIKILQKDLRIRLQMKHLNKNKNTPNYLKKLYDDETKELIYQKNKQIIKKFNYKFPY